MSSKKRRSRRPRQEFWRDRFVRINHTPHNAANRDAIASIVSGDAGVGARMVVNIPCAHVSSFCEETAAGKAHPYKNIYDLKRLGVSKGPSDTRLRVDAALPLPTGKGPEDIYFGALEVTGTGIRFYGDICLVLCPEQVTDDTLILETNSYDLEREPLVSAIERSTDPAATRRSFARAMAGSWSADRGNMAVTRVFQVLGERARRYTLGEIAEATRDDEDYIEVLRSCTFDANDIQEARLQPEDAALENRISERIRSGPTPSLAEIQWRQDRRRAEAALRAHGVPVRVVTTPGRTKTT